ncbi:hypothetical protein T265_09659 [Opisthorchis viverrini]|uniref:Uncharacterized protein n=1 Tax=Opisthorchis viverrini TaxID=6198 RepID=A0A075A477_OPIVI|nr:hypothetical protein T265_09659 [Opisthorchis viverrini]KER22174.1 hypothetical protein T265_09659 [Opisthorchis viverrini]
MTVRQLEDAGRGKCDKTNRSEEQLDTKLFNLNGSKDQSLDELVSDLRTEASGDQDIIRTFLDG